MNRSDPLALALRDKPFGAFAVVGEDVFLLDEYTIYLNDDTLHTKWRPHPTKHFPPSPIWWVKAQWARLVNRMRL